MVVGPNALIVEGGAMRSIVSCGVLDQFLAQQFSPFDSFWGVSAGANNLVAYLANMPRRNLKVYLDYSCRKNFIKPGRFIRGGDLMDLDWMWEISLRELGLDKQTLNAEKRPLFITVTRQSDGQAAYLSPSADQVAEAMKASSALPILYRRGVELDGTRYVDGGVADSIPLQAAIDAGAKNIMILRSRPESYRKPAPKWRGLTRRLLRETPGLIEPMLTRHLRYNQTLDLIASPPQGVKVLQFCPPEDFKLKRLSREVEPLEQAYQLGMDLGQRAIDVWQQQIEADSKA
ncbi:Predicted phospholipase, patatin/cPLA2 family [Vibrio xiamenensis]|uniref:Predicted phospholipase, patatin/cPLA2 family n=1 Tax=Vibrio xiamenensis TaxID=861298 RepID=A0A1G8DXB0_9VIBR|nr:patatin family protein [Vibrio xiamenensis]SDH62198.1 Predicted phospholipase, patatin/cPLA2 family [Vibrio xiamenensis]